MILFFKHLLRSIAKKPLQPIIMVFTLTLAILSTSLCVTVKDMLRKEEAILQAEKYGESDFTVTLNGTSKSRFMFAKRAEEILGGRAVAAGCYELPLTLGESKKTVFGVAADLTAIEKIFSFGFTEYGQITSSTLGDAALISRELAEANGIAIGDTVTVVALGEEKDYKVAGISEKRFMASYDVMVDITGVIKILAKDSAIISALGDDFKPSSTLYLKVNEGYTAAECIDILRTDDSFSEKTYSNLESLEGVTSLSETMSISITVAVLLTALLSAVITLSTLYVLASERTEENLIFSAAGAKASLLNTMQYAEVFLYWLVGGAIAFLLIVPCTEALASYVGFMYAPPRVAVSNVLLCAALILVISAASVTLFIATQKIKRHPRLEKKAQALPTLAVAAIHSILFTLLLIAPRAWKFVLYSAVIVSTVTLTFMGAPLLMKITIGAIDRCHDRRFEKSFRLKIRELKYAIKNASAVKMLYNTSRLVSIFVIVISTFMVVIFSSHGNVYVSQNIFSAEYAVFNATERCYGKLLQCESLSGCYKTYMGNAVEDNNATTPIFSATDISIFSEFTDVSVQPKGNEAVISSGQSKMLGLSVGDEFTVKIDGVPIELQVAQIASSGIAMIVFDAEHFDIPYNMIMVKGKTGVTPDEVIAEVSDKTAAELATIAPTADLMAEKVRTANVYLRASDVMLTVVSIFIATGLINNLYDSYRSRRGEFALYRFGGMSRGEVTRMKLYEILIMLVFGIGLGILGGVMSAVAVNAGLHNIGYETFLNFLISLKI